MSDSEEEYAVLTLLLYRAFRRVTSIISQQLHLHKFHIKTFKNT